MDQNAGQPIPATPGTPTATIAPSPETPTLAVARREPLTLRAEYSQTAPGVDRPESGAELMESTATGLGTLTVRNGTKRDAVVVMYVRDEQRRAVYVRAGTAARIPNVEVALYSVRFTSGAWWNGEEFVKETMFSEFERPLNFEETPEADAIAYSDFELTLQPVIGGNARTKSTAPFRLFKQIPLEGR